MRVSRNGQRNKIDDYIEKACTVISHKRSGRFVTVIKPKRGPDDLILPADLHAQVVDIGKYYRSWPIISENWGFDKSGHGGRGVKVLFTGDSGTGKTLAAEVIAGLVGTQLLKVELGQVTSKWLGVTEKNLETAFQEAEDSHAVLFFDECESLFGRRGESRTGTDRWANLEVSFLLMKLEDYDGLVILASNLKEQIDSAFMRRFHVVLRFPRPSESERHRLWQIAFPTEAPLSVDTDLEALSRLDMTGASIVASARTASLLAAGDSVDNIGMEHVVRAIARQFQQEARVLPTADLGFYAELLNEQP
jgi:SpoVK/Ycf46/Vps4 family AAA+-type ATPase